MTDRELTTDADIASARTPEAWLYRSADVLATVRERILPASWQALDARAPEPGHVAPCTLLPGALDEPLVLTTDAGGATRCLSNACTHRAHLVCTEAGARTGLRCGYHGRAFRLDGKLDHAPGFEGAQGFPSRADDLPELALGRLGPLLFTSFSAPLAFDDWIAPVRERCAWFPWGALVPSAELSRDYEVAANWALYCENYLEGLHIPYVHQGLARALEVSSYATETFAHGSLQLADADAREPAHEPPPGASDHGRRIAAYYWWLFPNTMLNVYPWGVSLNVVVPLAVDRTRVLFRGFVARPELVGAGAGADLDRVEMEDEAVVERVQQGLSARLYRHGRYAPAHERGTHWFHRLLADALRVSTES
jgi:choline monooxygenase